ncbi:hypothetical protein DPX16_20362 [Anabarilius grahami]|uniref:Uncharacterized protein n=1 Tax=Anabarilius grahami TaxID=495550 RepID=A0A3N0XJU0_ANAGA|nr:hypothetical protein DPX16_20362 [Anabarilius grahami]
MLYVKAAIVTEIEHCGKEAEAMSATINTAQPLVSTQQLHKERMRETIEKEKGNLAFHSELQLRDRRRLQHRREGCYALEMRVTLPTVMVCAYADSDSEFTAMLSWVFQMCMENLAVWRSKEIPMIALHISITLSEQSLRKSE